MRDDTQLPVDGLALAGQAQPGAGALPPLAPARPDKQSAKKPFPAGRLLRMGIAALLLVTGGAFVVDRFWSVQSTTALLDATPVTIRAPIDGLLRLEEVTPGMLLGAGRRLGAIRDELVDRGRQAQLAAAVSVNQQEIDALSQRIEDMRGQMRDAGAHYDNFRSSRVVQLTARLQEAETGIAAAQARQGEAVATLRRAEALANARVGTVAALDQARRGAAVAQADLAAALQRRNATRAEVAAAEGGVFGGDNSTDRSTSQQLQEQLRLQESELRAQLHALRTKLAGARAQLEAENTRLERSSQALLSSSIRARVASLLVQDGEFVRRGEPIAVLMDCRRPRVTAQVDEKVFRGLYLGKWADFVPAQGGERLHGEIVQLVSPLDDAPGAPRTNTYRAVLRLDAESLGDTCPIGRSGRVVF